MTAGELPGCFPQGLLCPGCEGVHSHWPFPAKSSCPAVLVTAAPGPVYLPWVQHHMASSQKPGQSWCTSNASWSLGPPACLLDLHSKLHIVKNAPCLDTPPHRSTRTAPRGNGVCCRLLCTRLFVGWSCFQDGHIIPTWEGNPWTEATGVRERDASLHILPLVRGVMGTLLGPHGQSGIGV